MEQEGPQRLLPEGHGGWQSHEEAEGGVLVTGPHQQSVQVMNLLLAAL